MNELLWWQRPATSRPRLAGCKRLQGRGLLLNVAMTDHEAARTTGHASLSTHAHGCVNARGHRRSDCQGGAADRRTSSERCIWPWALVGLRKAACDRVQLREPLLSLLLLLLKESLLAKSRSLLPHKFSSEAAIGVGPGDGPSEWDVGK